MYDNAARVGFQMALRLYPGAWIECYRYVLRGPLGVLDVKKEGEEIPPGYQKLPRTWQLVQPGPNFSRDVLVLQRNDPVLGKEEFWDWETDKKTIGDPDGR